ncbi:MAG: hypothetical protein CH6_0049 [Candidatus Kapaibacterium sp.]|nr:MAG: hypothetical protein CH6_0049 [Candidatus Kapabacteria bacterium]
MKTNKNINFRVDLELLEKAQKLAKSMDMSLSAFVRKALRMYVNAMEKKISKQKSQNQI